jgi:RNA polymerase sigma-70 factor, ECF subfamily
MTDATEQALIARAQQGDQQAFRLLVEAHQPRVYGIAFRLTQHETEAEDITQETFVKLWKNLSQYKPDHKLASWVGRMAANLALDHLRWAKNKTHNPLHEGLHYLPSTLDAESALHSQELHHLVLQLSNQLPPKQRAVFVLRDLEQFSPDEVANILAMNVANIKSNLCHARSTLKNLLKKLYN